MGVQLQGLRFLVGLVLYLFDVGSDIYVAFQYWKNDEPWWFGLTVGFISVPSLIVNVIAFIELMNIWSFAAAIPQLSIVARYIEALIKSSVDSDNLTRTDSLALLRYIQTITGSAPQCCLQVYIMLCQWSLPTYIVVSTVFSILSLLWSIMILEKERMEDDFTISYAAPFFTSQLLALIPRLSTIVIFAYVFQYKVVIPLAAHWLLLVLVTFFIEICSKVSVAKSLLFSMLGALPYLFHPAMNICPVKHPKIEWNVGFFILIQASVIMAGMSIGMPGVPHMEELQPIAIGITAGPAFLLIWFLRFWSACAEND